MEPMATIPPLDELIDIVVDLKIIDIGANGIDGEPPYKSLLDSGTAHLIGFEPSIEAFEELKNLKGDHETYFPYAVGDGKTHTLNICKGPGMTSLLTPNPEVLNCFHWFPFGAQIMEKIEIETVRLDDIAETAGADLLKIDIQGAELMVFQNAKERLKDISVIHTEVEFLPMYIDQPLFSEVEMFLRSCGFILHRFSPLVSRVIGPMMMENNPYKEFSQLMWADALFIKDFTKTDLLSDHQIMAMARIMHDSYKSIDLVLHLLTKIDQRNSSDLANVYMAGLQSCGTV